MKNPGFYCKDFIDTHNNLKQYQKSCVRQCDNCINKIIEHHKTKKLLDEYTKKHYIPKG